MYTHGIWDGQEPVNGNDASFIREHFGMTDGDVAGYVKDEHGRFCVLQFVKGQRLTEAEMLDKVAAICRDYNNPAPPEAD